MTGLFLDAEDSLTRPQTRALEWTLSLAVHGILVAAMFVGPLYWIDRIELHRPPYTQLVAITAELGSNAHVAAAPRNVVPATGKLAVPRSIPIQVAVSRPLVSETGVFFHHIPRGVDHRINHHIALDSLPAKQWRISRLNH